MLVSMKSILDVANRDNYGVMAVNSINIEIVRAVIRAAEEMKSPIIVQIGPGQMRAHAHPEDIVPVIKRLANGAEVPVALNLDHGGDLKAIQTGLKYGFTNVMIDASSLSFEENIARTRMVVDLAHQCGISVEAELGHVGQAAEGDYDKNDLLTDVSQAAEFVRRTGVDCLAVAFGTAHGRYPKGYVPKLDFERLAEIKKELKIPLVMHGGSGSGEENLRKAVANGINKINVCTDVFQVAKEAMLNLLKKNENADYLAMCQAAEQAVFEFVKNYIGMIGSGNRYIFSEQVQAIYE
ncbi:class II fructose-bisphosphate aldolase [Clostridiales bacterium COT073_COT-073]|nr:class II fructose-bisphosphate aldolase [Clostridiales bacterium COT073_COT-073]